MGMIKFLPENNFERFFVKAPAIFQEFSFCLISLRCADLKKLDGVQKKNLRTLSYAYRPVNRICRANRKCVLENFRRTTAEQWNIYPVLGTNDDTSS